MGGDASRDEEPDILHEEEQLSSGAQSPVHLGFLNLPLHIEEAYSYLLHDPSSKENVARKWGGDWDDCVHEYVEFEMRLGFPVSYTNV
jgi:hypothetical protein